MTDLSNGGAGYVLAEGEGNAIRFLETLMTVKAGSVETGNAFTLLEWTAPVGFAPPPHTHLVEDEAFYILEGSMSVTCGDKTWDAGAGSFVFLPRRIAHGFIITGDKPLRGLQLTAPYGFEQFIAEAGAPADAPVVATGPDIPRLLAAAEKHHLVIHAPSDGH